MTDTTVGVWTNEWQMPHDAFATTFRAKRARRRPSFDELGGEDYLVSAADTSHAARRRVSPYTFNTQEIQR